MNSLNSSRVGNWTRARVFVPFGLSSSATLLPATVAPPPSDVVAWNLAATGAVMPSSKVKSSELVVPAGLDSSTDSRSGSFELVPLPPTTTTENVGLPVEAGGVENTWLLATYARRDSSTGLVAGGKPIRTLPLPLPSGLVLFEQLRSTPLLWMFPLLS